MKRTPLLTIALLASIASVITAPAAFAKGQIGIRISDTTPRVGETFEVQLHTGWVVPHNDWLRLIAVAPGNNWYDVVGTVTGDSSLTHARIPEDGFEIKLKRIAPKQWRALVRLPKTGRWRLVVPNGTHLGFMMPPPTAWMPWVVVHP